MVPALVLCVAPHAQRVSLPLDVCAHLCRFNMPRGEKRLHSHSMVPGGLEVMSYTTRLTRGTRLQMRADTSRRSALLNSYLHMQRYQGSRLIEPTLTNDVRQVNGGDPTL